MKFKINPNKYIIAFSFILLFLNSYSQKTPTIKYLDEETLDEIKVDFDKDGDLDIIIAGVFVKKNQGRVYIIKNNGLNYDKPEYLFSFPSIGRKQEIEIVQDGNLTTINVIGTSPTGKQNTYTATLFNGVFEGLMIPPASSESN